MPVIDQIFAPRLRPLRLCGETHFQALTNTSNRGLELNSVSPKQRWETAALEHAASRLENIIRQTVSRI